MPKIDDLMLNALKRGGEREFVSLLAREGMRWWFEMDTPAILAHLALLNGKTTLPIRVRFLEDATKTNISHEKMEDYYGEFMSLEDFEAAAASVGAGIASVWDSGYDMKRYGIWRERIEKLLEGEFSLSPLAVASLKGFFALTELTGNGDLERAHEAYLEMRAWAEKAKSIPLLIYFSAGCAYCLTWMGRLSEAEVLIREAEPLCGMELSNLAVNVYFKIMEGHFWHIRGKNDKAEGILREVLTQPYFDSLPIPARLKTLGHLLLCVAHRGVEEEVEEVANDLRRCTVPERNYFHGAYSLYSLGTAYLLLKKPGLALAFGKEADRKGRLSGSHFISQIPPFIIGQALSDMGFLDEAIDLFSKWLELWNENGFAILAVSGAKELAGLYVKKGNMKKAREAHEESRKLLPKEEDPIHLNRSPDYDVKIVEWLEGGERTKLDHFFGEEGKTPVQIITFGDLWVRVGEKILGDGDWKSDRAKLLLKALIVFGGSNVPYQKLQDLLWPDSEGDVAENNLKVLISRLRKIGGNPEKGGINWILVKNKKVSLIRPVCCVDSISFLESIESSLKGRVKLGELKRALDLYRDDFLPGDHTEGWIVRHREALREKFVAGALTFSVAVRNIGEPAAAIPYLKKAIEKDPLNEELYARLMEIYLELGYEAKAARAYRAAESVFRKELGVEPGRVLKELAKKTKFRS